MITAHKGDEVRFILPNEVQTYLNEGWRVFVSAMPLGRLKEIALGLVDHGRRLTSEIEIKLDGIYLTFVYYEDAWNETGRHQIKPAEPMSLVFVGHTCHIGYTNDCQTISM
ncbi:hypothetical protein A2382_02560 [Candidatus Woesebacteria bacterium RIFOXYB1_FULL_38_16]|uniref:Uncharacterized protein n=1 Tax=Candidatus Woesebacteria bacterium RIFOXYB1_FULL_38_16 TaxID=1802538 RepID=A0A1F8CRE7_9BACT|nr:MAG: hypothetical protein A2191_01945 [Candidatus Woesebacteria bacterium RIFOXYA1_FULL_38_9]OGM78831.1 MAG: hypothetical protein A2382_02560 [Candidatus Woesebacteria bacterium RIFOXYB1_FULL_38_16]